MSFENENTEHNMLLTNYNTCYKSFQDVLVILKMKETKENLLRERNIE